MSIDWIVAAALAALLALYLAYSVMNPDRF
jgi:K+-transporting ATPase KdpF subunit